jgi:peptidyl-prolyl cis-trans isomerase D
MIRFLQKDNRLVKAIFVVIIAAAVFTMVITLVPGIFQDNVVSADTYATVYSGGPLTRLFSSGTKISTQEVQQVAQRQLQQQRLPDFALPFIVPRVATGMIQQAIMLQEAKNLGLKVTNEDLRQFLHTGMFGQILFPNGQFIGDDKYADLIQNNFGISRQDFEEQLKKELLINRLQQTVTGGVAVTDEEIRANYRKQATKIKIQYAVLKSEDLLKQINPTDAELQDYFKKNAARYATAIPEKRKIQYIAFDGSQVPGGTPQVSAQEIQQYYTANQKNYEVPDQVKVRHILIKVAPGADAKTDAAAKAKAEDILKQIKAGGNFADLAKKNSDDPGSKEQGGELGFLKHGVTVPEFDKAAFSLNPGQTSDLVKTQFGYHIIQVEEKQTAHTQSLAEVTPMIQALLIRQKEAQAVANYAQQLANEAAKNGLAKTADAHHLQVVTTDYLDQNGIISGLADGSKVLAQAFTAKQGAAPQTASTGEGYAVFQVADIKAAHAPNFDEYKPHILDDYRQQQLPQLLTRKLNELVDKAHSENDLEKAAKEVGATVQTSDLVGQDGQVPDIGQLATQAPALFDLKVGQMSNAINTGRNGVVAKLIDKQEPSPEEIAKNLDQTRDQVLAQRREEAFAVYVTTLQQKYQKLGYIRVNKKAQSAMQGSGLPS